MGNRISGFTVIFKEDVSESYMDKVKGLLYVIDGVCNVEEVEGETMASFTAKIQENNRIKDQLITLLKNDFKYL